MAPSPNLIGDAPMTNTVSVGRVPPFIGSSPCCAPRPSGTSPATACDANRLTTDYNRHGESIAAPRPWPPAGHEVRGAPASRLPSLLRPRPAQRHRGQHRARHQLLGHLSGVSF